MIHYDTMLFRLCIAALLGSMIGLERGRLDRAAGFRTHALVCVGSCLIMQVSAFGFSDILGTPNVVLDPSRIAAQVVSGIGFLGAGTIVVQHGSVRGLTTAASVWAVAAVGLATGAGLFFAAIAATVVSLIILAAVKPLERRIYGSRGAAIQLMVDPRRVTSIAISNAADVAEVTVSRIVVLPRAAGDRDKVEILISRASKQQLSKFLDSLRNVTGIDEVSWNTESAARSTVDNLDSSINDHEDSETETSADHIESSR